jgi:hypothetical protein
VDSLFSPTEKLAYLLIFARRFLNKINFNMKKVRTVYSIALNYCIKLRISIILKLKAKRKTFTRRTANFHINYTKYIFQKKKI